MDYDLGKVLKKTGYSIIQNATQKGRDSPLVIKRMDVDKDDKTLEWVHREVKIMSSIRHNNLMSMVDNLIHKNEIWVVMKKFDTSLGGLVYPKGIKNVDFLSGVFYHVSCGLQYLHHNNIIHRDIKGANILLSKEGKIVLADYGVSRFIENRADRVSSFVGTPCWMSPEQVESKKYDNKSDIWSIGITLLEAYFGSPPYADQKPLKIMVMISQNPPPVPTLAELQNHKTIHDFLKLTLIYEAPKRPNIETLLEHKFIKKSQRKNTRSEAYLGTRVTQYMG